MEQQNSTIETEQAEGSFKYLKSITPEWLESKGFALVTPQSMKEWEKKYNELFPGVFDIQIQEGDLCYLEKKLDRKQFCILLTPEKYDDGKDYYSFIVYIQDD